MKNIWGNVFIFASNQNGNKDLWQSTR